MLFLFPGLMFSFCYNLLLFGLLSVSFPFFLGSLYVPAGFLRLCLSPCSSSLLRFFFLQFPLYSGWISDVFTPFFFSFFFS